jgi:hypothetical protein
MAGSSSPLPSTRLAPRSGPAPRGMQGQSLFWRLEVRYEVDGSLRTSKTCPTQEDMLIEVEAGEKRYKGVGWLELKAGLANAALN